MTGTVMLVTDHPLPPLAVHAFVVGKGPGHRYLVAVPARIEVEQYDTFIADGVGRDPRDEVALASVVDVLPQQQGGNPNDPGQQDLGFAAHVRALALAGAVGSAIEVAAVEVDTCTVPPVSSAKRLAEMALEHEVEEVVVATRSLDPTAWVDADLTARIRRELVSLGREIPVFRHHFSD